MAFKFLLKNLETGKSKFFEFTEEGEYLVGRAKSCHIRVGHKQASSKHFKIIIKDSRVRVSDMNSHNGIFIDGVEVTGDQFYVGAILTFAAYQLTIDRKALSPKELVANMRESSSADHSDVTLIDASAHMRIDHERLKAESKDIAGYRNQKDVTLVFKKDKTLMKKLTQIKKFFRGKKAK